MSKNSLIVFIESFLVFKNILKYITQSISAVETFLNGKNLKIKIHTKNFVIKIQIF